MKTLILSPRYTPDSISLRSAALEAGWAVERLVSWRPPQELRERQGVEPVPYGEPLFAAVIADTFGLALIEPTFSWLAGLPVEFLKRKVEFTNLAKARKQSGKAFMKPADDKCFPADVYESGAELPAEGVLEPSVPVLISEPVSWEVEFRCFALEKKVATCSVYSRQGKTAQANDGSWPVSEAEMSAALEFGGKLLADPGVEFPPAAVVDIGIIAGRGWAVVEANACW